MAQWRRLRWLQAAMWVSSSRLWTGDFQETFPREFCSRGKALVIICFLNLNCLGDYTMCYFMWTYPMETRPMVALYCTMGASQGAGPTSLVPWYPV